MVATKVSSQNNVSISIDNDNDNDNDDVVVGRQQEVQSTASISSLWSGCTSVNIPSTNILNTRSILSFVNGMILLSGNTSVGGDNINNMIVESAPSCHDNDNNDEEGQVYEIPTTDTGYSDSNSDTDDSTSTSMRTSTTTIHNNSTEITKKNWYQSSDSDTVDTQTNSSVSESNHSSSNHSSFGKRYAQFIARNDLKILSVTIIISSIVVLVVVLFGNVHIQASSNKGLLSRGTRIADESTQSFILNREMNKQLLQSISDNSRRLKKEGCQASVDSFSPRPGVLNSVQYGKQSTLTHLL